MKWIIGLFGIGHLAFGGWAAIDPASFPASEFPPLNPHLTHDIAAAFLAFGTGLLIAAVVPSWRVPVLTLAAVWNAFHLVSHVVDVDRATSPAHGIAPIIQLAVITAVLAALAWRSRLKQ